jgi:hypothetical protein
VKPVPFCLRVRDESGGFEGIVGEAYSLQVSAARGVAHVLQVGDADFTGVEAVAGEAAQEGEEGDALAERSVLFGVLAEGDPIEDFLLLPGLAFEVVAGVAIGAEAVEPEKSAAEFSCVSPRQTQQSEK